MQRCQYFNFSLTDFNRVLTHCLVAFGISLPQHLNIKQYKQMKNTMLTIGLAGLTALLLSSFAFVQKDGETQEPKKSRHIRMVKTENGKKMELDTILTGDDVFVWNGDTVNPAKHIDRFDRGGFGGMHRFDGNIDRRGGNRNGMNFRHRGGEEGGPAIRHRAPRDEMDQIMFGRRMEHKPGNNTIHMGGNGLGHFPPMPPLPPVEMGRFQYRGQMINLDDPNIVSYKKRKMSGGREKIEIIRKKSGDNFRLDHQMMPPGMPEFKWESDGDSLRVKMIEKSLKGKDGKEIDVKVETEENK
jgi:hypothetical protein